MAKGTTQSAKPSQCMNHLFIAAELMRPLAVSPPIKPHAIAVKNGGGTVTRASQGGHSLTAPSIAPIAKTIASAKNNQVAAFDVFCIDAIAMHALTPTNREINQEPAPSK